MGRSLRGFICFRVGLLLLLIVGVVGEGQAQDQVRKYATNQEVNAGLLTSVSNGGNAVDANPRTYSSLNRLLGVGGVITVTQFLEFDDPQPAGKPLTVKLTFPSSILAVIGGVEIQPFTNLRNNVLTGFAWQADAAGRAYADNDLLGLLNGAGDMEVTLVPQTNGGTPVGYKGVWVRLQGLAVGQSLDLFHAYVKENGILACDEKDKAIDVLSGVRAGTAVGGIANATGSVENPWNVTNLNNTIPTVLNTGGELLSEVFHTTIFQTASQQNQVAKVVLQGSPSGLGELLDLSLLTGLVIQPYLGTTAVGGSINEATLLSLRLLPGSTDKFELAVPVEGSFDRIEIKMGGVLGALESLEIYEVSRLPALPVLDADVVIEKEFDVCEGEKATLTATAPPGSTLNWYESQDGGTSIGTDNTFTTGNLTESTTYYVSAIPTGCTVESIRLPIHVNVSSNPGNPNLSISNIND